MLPLSRIGFGKIYKAPPTTTLSSLNMGAEKIFDCSMIPTDWPDMVKQSIDEIKRQKKEGQPRHCSIVANGAGETIVVTDDDSKLWRAVERFAKSELIGHDRFTQDLNGLQYNEKDAASDVVATFDRSAQDAFLRSYFTRLQQDATADIADGI